jgi:hypothetical protein
MDYRPDGATRFEHAKRTIADIVEQSPQGDGFTLVLMTTPARTVVQTPSFDKQVFLTELDALQRPDAEGDLAGALRAAESVIQSARRDERKLARDEVYFVSDLGRVSWRPRDRAALEAIHDRAEALANDGAQLVVVDLGQADEGNVAVSDLTSLAPLATTRSEVDFQVQLRNFGRAARPEQKVSLFLDGARAAERTIHLPAGGTASAMFRARFDTPGDHVVEARAEGDRLEVDNHRYLSLPVKNRVRVLCVDGRPASGGENGATDYLRVALAPSAERGQQRVDVEVVTEATWLEGDLALYDCIVLAEVKEFTAAEARALTSYLGGGGGLVTILGPGVNAANYNARLAATGILPATLGAIEIENTRAVDPLGYQHPIVAPFRDQEQAGLLTTPVSKYFRLTPAAERGAQVALALSGGDPLIVTAPAGRGVSILLATSAADRDWTLLPVWPSFVPLVQETLVAAMKGQSDDHNLLVGQTITGTLPAIAADATVTVTTPEGSERTTKAVSTADVTRWSFADTQRSGVYGASWQSPGDQDARYADNVDTAESDLARVDETTLRGEIWKGIDFQILNEARGDAAASAALGGRGAPLHFALLLLALALMFVESTLACFLGARQA